MMSTSVCWLLLYFTCGIEGNLAANSQALMNLYRSTSGDNWNLRCKTGWGQGMGTTQVCRWPGVFCGPLNRTVLSLDVDECGLEGILPDCFGNLTNLTVIKIGSNPQLRGTIPPSFLTLWKLTHFHAATTSLVGPLDFLAHLPLEVVDMSTSPSLTAPLPEFNRSVYPLVNIQFNGSPISGQIPASFCKLKLLEQMLLKNTNLSGPLPKLECFPTLAYMDLSYSHFSGSINWPNHTHLFLWRLNLDHMNLSGVIPPFKPPPFLAYISLASNHFSGPLPTSFCEMEALNYLNASDNEFTELPDCTFRHLVPLSFSAARNRFDRLPTAFWNSTSFEELDLSANNISLARFPFLDSRPSLLSKLKLADNPLNCAFQDFTRKIDRFFTLANLDVSNCSLYAKPSSGQKNDNLPVPLRSLDISHNPGLQNTFSLRPASLMSSIDMSYTRAILDIQTAGGINLELVNLASREINTGQCGDCFPSNLATLQDLKSIIITNLTCLQNCIADAIVDNAEFLSYFSDVGLFCPQRRLRNGAPVTADEDVLFYRGCACQPTWWWNGTQCHPCSPHMICNATVYSQSHSVEAGYYPLRHNRRPNNSDLPISLAVQCMRVDDCNPDPDIGFVCGEGRRLDSLLCSQCNQTYFRLNNDCVECKGVYRVLIPITVPIVVAILTAYLWKMSANPSNSAQLSIGFFAVQVLGVLEVADLQYDNTIGWTVIREVLSFRPWAIECMLDDVTFESYFWLRLAFPFVIALLCFAPTLCVTRNRHRFVSVFAAALDLGYLPLCNTVFSVFQCVHQKDVTTQVDLTYLSAAPYLACGDSRVVAMQICAGFSVVVYVIGIPTWFTYSLQRFYAANAKDSKQFPLYFLTAPLRKPSERFPVKYTYVWLIPCLFMVRKVGLIALLNFLPTHSGLMPMFALLLLLLSEMAMLVRNPYVHVADCVTEVLLILGCLTLYFVRILMNSGSGDFDFKNALVPIHDGLEFLMHICIIVMIIICFLRLRFPRWFEYCWPLDPHSPRKLLQTPLIAPGTEISP